MQLKSTFEFIHTKSPVIDSLLKLLRNIKAPVTIEHYKHRMFQVISVINKPVTQHDM